METSHVISMGMESVYKKKGKAVFVSDFGGFPIIERDKWLLCIEKNVKIEIAPLIHAVKVINRHPKGTKILVGRQIIGHECAYIWRDEFKTYIGCLDEMTTDFNKKYVKLIKHLNNK